MGEVPMRELNQQTRKVINRVKAGEEIAVTDHGELIAHIIPAATGPLTALISAGKVLPAAQGPAPRAMIHAPDQPEAGALLEKLRSEERY
ncbi:type II toxin-antitoxin system Phd/YefM family antitoxin [Mycobacteroides abscessus]|uniref:type II toxin-antitoxin system Phd/YefM family antitoxin n=1 Tax=Mycobacteroides abscessus TaxID=36809 RepID=UPI0009A81059|nr:type II toxin-antitoxin system prevent-host-death family antitoxin [Mycobacteroides abscessus]MDO3032201.1 type II toxin-antitoxin system prevent-host-death family antitoxin [Mycobacteroides abscessus subsp. massiliense]RIR19244.1 type II toxin-antitoxin system prevent-host-death family antitoxin [Mycobacteroides abscessus]